jgi:hypothetical protein
MDWEKVVAKLRATADQHAKNAHNEMMRGNKNMMEAEHRLSEIFYGLTASLEAGLDTERS